MSLLSSYGRAKPNSDTWSAELSSGRQRTPCPLCGGQTITLPVPGPKCSIVSDGRLVEQALKKLSCLACGVACHASHISPEEVQAIYAHDYVLADVSPSSNADRGRAYADWLVSQLPPPRAMLEIGCGSGALLRTLSNRWPEAVCTGIDPVL